MAEKNSGLGLRECYKEGCVKSHCPKCGGHLERVESKEKEYWCEFCKEYFEEDELGRPSE